MRRILALPAIVLALASLLPVISSGDDNTFDEVATAIYRKQWERAERAVTAVDEAGGCGGARCTVFRARIAQGRGDTPSALRLATEALATPVDDAGLTAGDYNELGALIYHAAGGDHERLAQARTAFERSVASHRGAASNPRYNLAVVLGALGETGAAEKLMAEVESDRLLIDPSMSILADFRTAGRVD